MKYILVLIFSIFVSLNIYSQEKVDKDLYQGLYFTGGLGYGSISLAGNISTSFYLKQNIGFTVGYNGDSHIYFGPDTPDEFNRSTFILVGIADSNYNPRLVFSSGISFNKFNDSENNAGLQLRLEAFIIKSKREVFGLSINGFGNINSYRNFGALTFSLNFGML